MTKISSDSAGKQKKQQLPADGTRHGPKTAGSCFPVPGKSGKNGCVPGPSEGFPGDMTKKEAMSGKFHLDIAFLALYNIILYQNGQLCLLQ